MVVEDRAHPTDESSEGDLAEMGRTKQSESGVRRRVGGGGGAQTSGSVFGREWKEQHAIWKLFRRDGKKQKSKKKFAETDKPLELAPTCHKRLCIIESSHRSSCTAFASAQFASIQFDATHSI